MSSYSEDEIAVIALEVIKENDGIRTSELISKVRAIMNPSGDDLTILKDRCDDKFSQKVRNLKSHDTLSDKVSTTEERNCEWRLKNK